MLLSDSSSPDGIMGTMLLVGRSGRNLLAQRLTATIAICDGVRLRGNTACGTDLLVARHYLEIVTAPHSAISISMLCSTPRGFIGIFTAEFLRDPPDVVAVLNASQHHWNIHAGRGLRSADRGRVLNASRHRWYPRLLEHLSVPPCTLPESSSSLLRTLWAL